MIGGKGREKPPAERLAGPAWYLERLKEFRFRQRPAVHAGQERLDALGAIVQGRMKAILMI